MKDDRPPIVGIPPTEAFGSGPGHDLTPSLRRSIFIFLGIFKHPYLYTAFFSLLVIASVAFIAIRWTPLMSVVATVITPEASNTSSSTPAGADAGNSSEQQAIENTQSQPQELAALTPETSPDTEPDAPAPNPKPAMANSIYWGATNRAGLSDFETRVGKRSSVFDNFYPWGSNTTFPTSWVNTVRNRGTIPMVSWNPFDSTKPNAYTFDDILAGKYDSYITQWATSAKQWGHPMFLRFMHEANGSWYSWSVKANGADKYIAVWRHVHDIFTKVGANQVTWVWCPNVQAFPDYPKYATFYPGDQYVDWIGLDGYNRNTYKSFSTLFGASYNEITALTNKPLMIAENGSAAGSGAQTRSTFLADALGTQLPQNFPRVKAYLYFDNADDVKLTDQAGMQAFAAISSSYYASNSFATISGKIQPPQ